MNLPLTVPIKVLSFLQWWTNPYQMCMGVHFLPSYLDKTIITNMSLLGWGIHMDNHTTQETWTPQETRVHIDAVELWAVRKALWLIYLT